MLKRLLFPVKPDGTATSAMLLIARIVFGILLMNHGIQKWSNFQEMSAVFPDPLGIGSPLSLGLAIFGELVCSMAFIIGFLYRLAMIPMIFTMIVAFFVVHANDVFAVKDRLRIADVAGVGVELADGAVARVEAVGRLFHLGHADVVRQIVVEVIADGLRLHVRVHHRRQRGGKLRWSARPQVRHDQRLRHGHGSLRQHR